MPNNTIINENYNNNTSSSIILEEVIKEDTKDNNETNDRSKLLHFLCQNSYPLFIINAIFIVCFFIVLVALTALYNSNLNYKFWLNQVIKYLLLSFIQFLMALLVVKKDVKVNYTRKVVHISYFILPQLLDITIFKYRKDKYTEFWNVWLILYLLLILSEHVRKRLKLIDYMFKAVDRPEDRPYTLIWFSSQIITTLIIIIPFSVYFSKINKVGLVFIPILINGLADGLAEPVGIRFGKHKYKTKGCLSNKEYERSYEGSLCVFIVSNIIVLSYYKYMEQGSYIFNVLTIPSIITFTEAYAPHTWDSPCIFLVVCSLLSISTLL